MGTGFTPDASTPVGDDGVGNSLRGEYLPSETEHHGYYERPVPLATCTPSDLAHDHAAVRSLPSDRHDYAA